MGGLRLSQILCPDDMTDELMAVLVEVDEIVEEMKGVPEREDSLVP
jgi:hypothetical protein